MKRFAICFLAVSTLANQLPAFDKKPAQPAPSKPAQPQQPANQPKSQPQPQPKPQPQQPKPPENKPKLELPKPKPKPEPSKPTLQPVKPKVEIPTPKVEGKPSPDLGKPKVELPKPGVVPSQPKTEPNQPKLVTPQPKTGLLPPAKIEKGPSAEIPKPDDALQEKLRGLLERNANKSKSSGKVLQLVPDGGKKPNDGKVLELVPDGGKKGGDGKVLELVPDGGKKGSDSKVLQLAPKGGKSQALGLGQPHHGSHTHPSGVTQSKVQARDLIQLFLLASLLNNRPYGYGGYYNEGHYHHGHQHHPPYVVVPVQPLQPNVANPPPPPRLVVPTPDQFGSLAEPHQRELLLHAINSLNDDLARTPSGDLWRRHLLLDGLQESLAEIDGPLDATERERYRIHAEVFDEVAQQPAYRAITELWGFATLRIGLREFSLEPVVRIRRAIAMNAEWFSKSLDGVSTGGQWKQHFRISQLLTRDVPALPPVEELAAFEPILRKFVKVKDDPQFEAIASLPGFLPTLAALTDYIAELQLLAAPPPENPPAPGGDPLKALPPPPSSEKSGATDSPKPRDEPKPSDAPESETK